MMTDQIKLIAVAGSQGTGKSTILASLKEEGYAVVERKTSRSILSEWNITLNDLRYDMELAVRFQEEVLRRKYEDERNAMVENASGTQDNVLFTERTYADLFSYALITLGSNNDVSEWLDAYYRRCRSLQAAYAKVIYLRGGMFEVEHDGVRGSNQHYSDLVTATMDKYIRDFTDDGRLQYVSSGVHEYRMNIIRP